MENNHLTYFKIENFKKFDSLEVNDIGQFNLIVGDNNVGKTCLLEALLFDEDSQQLLDNFYLALTKRGLKFEIEEITKRANNISTTETIYPKENYFKEYVFGNELDNLNIYYFTNDKKKHIQIKIFTDFEFDKDVDNMHFGNNLYIDNNIKKEDLKNQFISIIMDKGSFFLEEHFWIYDYNLDILNFPLVSFNDTPLEDETIKIYETLKTEQEIEILTNSLKIVNNKIKRIDFRANFNDLKSVFLFSIDGEKELIPLNLMGDGFKRIFYIVLKMLSLKGKRILIDEIEIGIHHSKMKDFWINIMKVCKELDVQLFATTHSQECTESYIEASNILNYNNEIRLIKLEESTNKDKIYASTFTYNQISAGLDSNVELRG